MADIYKDTANLYLEINRLVDCMKRMAYKGEWEKLFPQLHGRRGIRKNIYIGLSGADHYYIARPEYESDKGYADIFL